MTKEIAPEGTKHGDPAPPCPFCAGERYWSDYWTDEFEAICVECVSYAHHAVKYGAVRSWRTKGRDGLCTVCGQKWSRSFCSGPCASVEKARRREKAKELLRKYEEEHGPLTEQEMAIARALWPDE